MGSLKFRQLGPDEANGEIIGQDKVILILFVLSSEDVSLMSGLGPSFWTLSIMLGNNA